MWGSKFAMSAQREDWVIATERARLALAAFEILEVQYAEAFSGLRGEKG
jgi:hypothetical protein